MLSSIINGTINLIYEVGYRANLKSFLHECNKVKHNISKQIIMIHTLNFIKATRSDKF